MRNCFCKNRMRDEDGWGNRCLSILVNEELLLQAWDSALLPSFSKPLSILVNEELLLQVFRNLLFKHQQFFSFNPREWGTAFASQVTQFYKMLNIHFLSILVNEELLLQVFFSFLIFCVTLCSFNPREWGTAFARDEELLRWRVGEETFQSSWMRNCFCKLQTRLWRRLKTKGLSILVNEELLLQGECILGGLLWIAWLSILVNEELLLQVSTSAISLSASLTFNPREWGTAFARSKWGLMSNELRKNFQSSWMRNCFCKEVTSIHFQVVPRNFQSSWMRNCFCKLRPQNLHHNGHDTAFNPREWGTAFARVFGLWTFVKSPRAFNPREWGTAFASHDVCVTHLQHLSFNPREWGTAFAS